MPNFAMDLLQIMFCVSVLIFILIIFRPVLLSRYKSAWRRTAWLLLALRLIIPFSFSLPSFVEPPITVPVYNVNINVPKIARISTEIAEAPVYTNSNTESNTTNSTDTTSKTTQSIPLSQLLFTIWISVAALIFGFRLLLYIIAKSRILKYSVRESEQQLILHEVCNALNVKRKIKVKTSSKAGAPMLMGILRPVIILPKAQFADKDLSMIFSHEITHYKNKDIWFKMLLNFVCCLYWFNPLIWIMSSLAGRDIELACDEKLLNDKKDDYKQDYSDTIMLVLQKNAIRPLLCATSFSGTKHDIKLRFSQIFNTKNKKRGIASLLCILIIASVLSTLVACKQSTPDDAQNSSSQSPNSQNTSSQNSTVQSSTSQNSTSQSSISQGSTSQGSTSQGSISQSPLANNNSATIAPPSPPQASQANVVWPTPQQENKIVIINTYDDLIAMATDENANGYARKNITYELGQDIDCEGKEIIPIGYQFIKNTDDVNAEYKVRFTGFCSVFDGKGHSISNFTIKTSLEKSRNDIAFSRVGLFNIIGTFGEVKNLNISKAKITVDTRHAFFATAGILAGECFGKITNCNVSGTLEGSILIGGLVGNIDFPPSLVEPDWQKAVINNCTVKADIKGVSSVGLLCGNASNCTINSSKASGTITAYRDDKAGLSMTTPWGVGGFVGDSYGSILNDNYCNAQIKTLDSGSAIGAFAGSVKNGIWKNNICKNKGIWDVIDWVEEKNATAQNLIPYDVKAE